MVSDAGDQQQLRSFQAFKRSDDFSDDSASLNRRLSSLSVHGSEHELQNRILSVRVQTYDNEGRIQTFIPKAELYKVVDVDSVTRVLRKELSNSHTSQSIKYYAERVCTEAVIGETRKGRAKIKSFRKIFALLVLVERSSSIPLLLQEDISDQDLPLSLGKDGRVYRRASRSQDPLKCFQEHDIWSVLKMENFQTWQWWMLAPFFSYHEDDVVSNYILQENHILPFISLGSPEEHILNKSGGFGKVFMVRIHPEHYDFPDRALCERGFAVKQQLHERDREAFKREIEILMKFSGERMHKHVVSLLATYEQFRKFHLIFHKAEGDLFYYWKDLYPKPRITYLDTLWFAEQCTGIADGLSKLHRVLSFPNSRIGTNTRSKTSPSGKTNGSR